MNKFDPIEQMEPPLQQDFPTKPDWARLSPTKPDQAQPSQHLGFGTIQHILSISDFQK